MAILPTAQKERRHGFGSAAAIDIHSDHILTPASFSPWRGAHTGMQADGAVRPVSLGGGLAISVTILHWAKEEIVNGIK